MLKRLFIGLELPPEIRTVLATLDPQIKGLRWLPEEQMHLTMSFLGTVLSDQQEQMQEALAAVQVPPFFLLVQALGAFGGNRPTVVWAGVGKGHPHLFALHKRVQDALLAAGLEPDLRSFHPHITVARAKGVSRAALEPVLRQYAETEFGLWKVSGFTVFSSELQPTGATHSVEMRREF